MERLCMRPGCDRSVVARLTYDTISCQVWLDPVRERPGPAQEICELHTARLTVPRGWMLCDRRDESPALFVPEPPVESPARAEPRAAIPPPRATAAVREERTAPEVQPDLFGAPAHAEERSTPVERIEPRVERRVERRVAQTVPVAPAAVPVVPAVAPVMPAADPPSPERPEPAVVSASHDRPPDAPPAVAGNGSRNGARNGERASDDREAEQHDDEDLPESLQATSPLLSRAFRATGHQRSVLTQTLLNDTD